MKVSVVPAQVTTIEDRIAGNLGLSQLLLLTLPVFGGSGLYIILPPFIHSAPYKLVVITILAFVSCLLAIRVRGKLVLQWLVAILTYNLRPRYYVYNRRSLAGRPYTNKLVEDKSEVEATQAPSKQHRLLPLSTADMAKVQALMEHPAAHLTFKTNKRGGLRVLITEVKE